MVELAIWVLFGMLSGWIGYLATRTEGKTDSRPFITVGIAGAVIGGFVTSRLGNDHNGLASNTDSLIYALTASIIFTALFGYIWLHASKWR